VETRTGATFAILQKIAEGVSDRLPLRIIKPEIIWLSCTSFLETPPSFFGRTRCADNINPIDTALEKPLDAQVAHHPVRLRKVRQTTHGHRAAQAKKRRTAMSNNFPKKASVTHRQ
jgi:hypothetical protein